MNDLIDTSRRDDGVNAANAEALFVNLVIVSVVNGHYARAQEILSNILAKGPTQRTYVLLQVYLDLAQGNRDKAVEVIRKHNTAPPLR
jgi:hypothetical protein